MKFGVYVKNIKNMQLNSWIFKICSNGNFFSGSRLQLSLYLKLQLSFCQTLSIFELVDFFLLILYLIPLLISHFDLSNY